MPTDPQLLSLAKEYAEAFRAALVKTEKDYREVLRGRGNGFSTGEHGTVEFTQDLLIAGRKLADRASTSFGAHRIHDKSVEEAARSVLFQSDLETPIKTVAQRVIGAISDAATKTYRVIRPNQLFRLTENVGEIRVGPVRVVKREVLSVEIERDHKKLKIVAPATEGNAISIVETDDEMDAEIHLPDVCWDVTIQGMPKKIEHEALWLVDVAVSFARLQFDQFPGLFPRLRDVEPHPIRPYQWTREGLVISANKGLQFGGGTAPTWYEVGQDMADKFSDPQVRQATEQIFDPSSRSVGERLQQVLGWMSRARQAAEPAERVLLFFTAIEALLSSSEKDVPITESIARGASVMWSSKQSTRVAFYKSIKKLYGTRSRIIHNGFRSVAEIEANNVHHIIWNLAHAVLHKVDLTQPHAAFLDELKEASFGREWNPTGVPDEPNSDREVAGTAS
ncbi:hypothetical protein GFL72_28640 [Rhizobium leguminosarum bv. viciae]|uniref:HEPN domain-containing protein n=1 Tax=Rhizobium leguminosarum TaxID=384 RepID=UPI00144192A2|nr:HEPN domain-containing protein [Rhizobium leguminosarum]NKK38550.1 hypothetical protein [Rhizobium leguminosarum bv. viciae]